MLRTMMGRQYRLRLSAAEQAALKGLSAGCGASMSSWVKEAAAVCAELAGPGHSLPERAAVDHYTGASMARCVRNAGALIEDVEALRRDMGREERALRDAGRMPWAGTEHVLREEAERAGASAAAEIARCAEAAAAKAAGALDELAEAEARVRRVIEVGPIPMPATRAVPHRDALPGPPEDVARAIEYAPDEESREALASSLRVARELPPVVALPERVGGPRDRQLPMRLTEGEADALREAAARFGLDRSEFLRRAAWAYRVVLDPALPAERVAVDYGAYEQTRRRCFAIARAADGLAAWARGLPSRPGADVLARDTSSGERLARAAGLLAEALPEVARVAESVHESVRGLDGDALARLAPLPGPSMDMLLPRGPMIG